MFFQPFFVCRSLRFPMSASPTVGSRRWGAPGLAFTHSPKTTSVGRRPSTTAHCQQLCSVPPAPLWTWSPGEGEGKWCCDSHTHETKMENVPALGREIHGHQNGLENHLEPSLGSSRWRQILPPLLFRPRWNLGGCGPLAGRTRGQQRLG